MKFYTEWYIALPVQEKDAFLGQWILQRIHWYDAAIRDIEAAIVTRLLPTGNYLSN